jgi:rhodanese-related sulfurtransferase
MRSFRVADIFIQDLKWSLIFGLVSLFLAIVWQWSFMAQTWQGKLFSQIKELEDQELARRLQGIRTFNLEQAYALFQQGKALFVDARPPGEYRELHIEGAINLSADQFKHSDISEMLKKIEARRPMIVYCAHEDCHASLQVAELLQNHGFSQVAVFLGGFRSWDEAGYPVDVSR